jgi:hypothetical protein
LAEVAWRMAMRPCRERDTARRMGSVSRMSCAWVRPAGGVREREVCIVPDCAENYVGDGVHGPVAVAGKEHAADVLLSGVAGQHGKRPEVEAMDGTVEGHL